MPQAKRSFGRTFGLTSCCVLATMLPVPSSRAEKDVCFQAVIDAEVRAGQGYEKVFAGGLRFFLEPLHSGWIVRVLDAKAPRSAHDYAELATPPYLSVTPLLISTDWAFRAQDAVAWNPRHFRYAWNKVTFLQLEKLRSQALGGNSNAEVELASTVSIQPEATLEILDARLAPGVADQAKMASAVALHLGTTPHEVDTNAVPSPLGALEGLHFRVSFHLPRGIRAAKGVEEHTYSCAQPTTPRTVASQLTQSRKQK